MLVCLVKLIIEFFCTYLSSVVLWMKSGFIFKDSLSLFIPASVLVFLLNFTLGPIHDCILVLLQTSSHEGHAHRTIKNCVGSTTWIFFGGLTGIFLVVSNRGQTNIQISFCPQKVLCFFGLVLYWAEHHQQYSAAQHFNLKKFIKDRFNPDGK